MSHQQALAQVTAQATHSHAQNNSLAEHPSSRSSSTFTSGTNSHNFESTVVPYCDQIFQSAVIVVDKLVDDGYNWRKYGKSRLRAVISKELL
ncbi:putative WRKY transcription factor 4 [Platanthera zijinensis]|uniref:WRKY transcription factor 4 n=1 Tax=Platanthera zijinensis TaxID=2320716 RepID=A0AAP0AWX7_9ASPA